MDRTGRTSWRITISRAAIVILGVSLTTRGKKDAKKETPLAFPENNVFFIL
jgi:hypothetical protein